MHLRSDRAATDPVLVIAAIAVSLILLIGGSFAVAGMIANGKDLNAKADLDRVATAETALSASGKSVGVATPIVMLSGTLPDPSGASAVTPASVNVNYGVIGYSSVTLASGGSSWILNTAAYVNGSWTPTRSTGSHSWVGGALNPSTELNPDSGITYDLTGITKGAGPGSVTLSVALPAASTGFAPYLSSGTGNVAADLSAGGSTPARALEHADVGFTVSDDAHVAVTVSADGTGWVAVSTSGTGKTFVRTSTGTTIGMLGGTAGARTVPNGVTLPSGFSVSQLNQALTNAGGF